MKTDETLIFLKGLKGFRFLCLVWPAAEILVAQRKDWNQIDSATFLPIQGLISVRSCSEKGSISVICVGIPQTLAECGSFTNPPIPNMETRILNPKTPKPNAKNLEISAQAPS